MHKDIQSISESNESSSFCGEDEKHSEYLPEIVSNKAPYHPSIDRVKNWEVFNNPSGSTSKSWGSDAKNNSSASPSKFSVHKLIKEVEQVLDMYSSLKIQNEYSNTNRQIKLENCKL